MQQEQQQVAVEIVPDRPLAPAQPLASLRALASFRRSRLPAQGDADDEGAVVSVHVSKTFTRWSLSRTDYGLADIVVAC